MNRSSSNILKSPNCGICTSSSAQQIESTDRSGKPLRVVVCGNCGVVRNDPIPSPTELQEFYSNEYRASYKGTREPRLRHAARYFPLTANHIRDEWPTYKQAESFLDIGSGSGEFLFLMQQLGKTTMGLEPSLGYSEFCRTQLGLNITTGEIDSFQPPHAFDHIRLSHVVEHLCHPVDQLRQISGWLNEKGTIYIDVPDFEAYCRDKTPGRMFHYGHIYNFDSQSFEYLMAASGLRIDKRIGPTTAFLKKSAGNDTPKIATPSQLEEKLKRYEMHRTGKLRSKVPWSRIKIRLARILEEFRAVRNSPDYRSIGESSANTLKEKITHRVANS